MTTTVNHPSARSRTKALLVLAAGVAAVPSLLGLIAVGSIIAGPLGPVAPLAVIAATFAYRSAVRGTTAGLHVTVREVGGAVIGAALAFGTYVAMIFVGIGLDVVPFMASSGAYDSADEWHAFSVLVSVVSAIVVWWVLRRWAEGRNAR